jgi:hypothetical protein
VSEETVQPDESAEVVDSGGSEGQGDTPYGEYLERVPEAVRGEVEPIFKEWDANVTKRFQEASEFRKQYEGLAELGVGDVPRDELENLIALRELAANNPEGFDAWLRDTATQRGLLPGELDESQVDEFGDPVDEKIAPLQQEIEAMKSQFEQQQEAARIAEATKQVEAQIAEQEKAHPDVPRDLAEQFFAAMAETDPNTAVERSFAEAEKWMNQIQKQTLAQKVEQPRASESGSQADGSPEPVRNFKDAAAQALQQLQNR